MRPSVAEGRHLGFDRMTARPRLREPERQRGRPRQHTLGRAWFQPVDLLHEAAESAATIGVAKELYNEAQKPENQRRIRETIDKVKIKREQRRVR